LRWRNHIGLALVTVAVTLPATFVSAKLTMASAPPSARLAKVGAYPTAVVATVKSVEFVSATRGSVLGETSLEKKVLCLLKLRIHSSRALTPMGTPIEQDESIRVISTEPLDKALVGKTVKASIEMRSDDTREQWLLTDVLRRQ
jgi:hypothetical protein